MNSACEQGLPTSLFTYFAVESCGGSLGSSLRTKSVPEWQGDQPEAGLNGLGTDAA